MFKNKYGCTHVYTAFIAHTLVKRFGSNFFWSKAHLNQVVVHTVSLYLPPNDTEVTYFQTRLIKYVVKELSLTRDKDAKIIFMGDLTSNA